MDIQYIILGFLMEKSMTGYDIRQKFSKSFSFFSGISFGSIYPALKRMEKDGLIRTRTEIQDGSPNKKICTITEKGRGAFSEALRSPLPLDRYKNSFLARLFFFAHLTPDERHEFTQCYLNGLDENLRNLDLIQPGIEKHADPFQLLCFQCGQEILNALIEIIGKAHASLRTIEEQP